MCWHLVTISKALEEKMFKCGTHKDLTWVECSCGSCVLLCGWVVSVYLFAVSLTGVNCLFPVHISECILKENKTIFKQVIFFKFTGHCFIIETSSQFYSWYFLQSADVIFSFVRFIQFYNYRQSKKIHFIKSCLKLCHLFKIAD